MRYFQLQNGIFVFLLTTFSCMQKMDFEQKRTKQNESSRTEGVSNDANPSTKNDGQQTDNPVSKPGSGSTSPQTEKPINMTSTKFGVFYHTWHCHASNNGSANDLTEILAGRGNYGDYGKPHWWGKPNDGYYCLSQNDALLKKHAEQIRDMGMDFVFIDVTNHAHVGPASHDTPGMILKPLDRLLEVWSKVANAPKIVFWVPVVDEDFNANENTVDALMTRLEKYPGMEFRYLNKPLLLITETSQYPVNSKKEDELEKKYTTRRMWANMPQNTPDWSFLERCRKSPTVDVYCQQRVSMKDGVLEQIPVMMAYQQNFMNNSETATPKLKGLTFKKQFETVFRNNNAPIVTITGWNEWITGRYQCDSPATAGTCPCSKFPQGCFLDQYNDEYSRDIEAASNSPMGDYYYRLVQSCVLMYKSGRKCDLLNQSELCCKK